MEKTQTNIENGINRYRMGFRGAVSYRSGGETRPQRTLTIESYASQVLGAPSNPDGCRPAHDVKDSLQSWRY
jgi:hypothetical protein